jgi:transcription initiation factor IIE alpha subunit
MTTRQKYGFVAPVKVIAAIYRRPKTLEQIAKKTGLKEDTVKVIMTAIRDMGMAHVKDWQIRPGKWALRMYQFGPGVDAPAVGKPRKEASVRRNEFCTRQVIKFIQVMQEDPATRKELMHATEIVQLSCAKLLKLLKDHGLIHIAGYCRKGHDGIYSQQFLFGPGVDAERPKPIPPSQCVSRYRKSRKALSSDVFTVALMQIQASNEERQAA